MNIGHDVMDMIYDLMNGANRLGTDGGPLHLLDMIPEILSGVGPPSVPPTPEPSRLEAAMAFLVVPAREETTPPWTIQVPGPPPRGVVPVYLTALERSDFVVDGSAFSRAMVLRSSPRGEIDLSRAFGDPMAFSIPDLCPPHSIPESSDQVAGPPAMTWPRSALEDILATRTTREPQPDLRRRLVAPWRFNESPNRFKSPNVPSHAHQAVLSWSLVPDQVGRAAGRPPSPSPWLGLTDQQSLSGLGRRGGWGKKSLLGIPPKRVRAPLREFAQVCAVVGSRCRLSEESKKWSSWSRFRFIRSKEQGEGVGGLDRGKKIATLFGCPGSVEGRMREVA